jgi:hemerythrin superfamily protein
LRSKENTLTQEIIKKHLDYGVPASTRKLQKDSEWLGQIVKTFAEHNCNELSIDEAQDQFLTVLAGF